MKFIGKCKDSKGNVMDLYEMDGKTYRENPQVNVVNPPQENPGFFKGIPFLNPKGKIKTLGEMHSWLKKWVAEHPTDESAKKGLEGFEAEMKKMGITNPGRVYLWTGKKPIPPGKAKARITHHHGKTGHPHKHKGTLSHHPLKK